MSDYLDHLRRIAAAIESLPDEAPEPEGDDDDEAQGR